jgi:hypothetical protein
MLWCAGISGNGINVGTFAVEVGTGAGFDVVGVKAKKEAIVVTGVVAGVDTLAPSAWPGWVFVMDCGDADAEEDIVTGSVSPFEPVVGATLSGNMVAASERTKGSSEGSLRVVTMGGA